MKHKRFLKAFSALALCAALMAATVAQYSGAMYFYSDGFSYYMQNSTDAAIAKYDDSSNDVVIPAYLGGSYVTKIDNYTFMNHSSITSVDFSNAAFLKEIGKFAFSGTSISSLNITSQITTLGSSAFQNCKSLTEVSVGNKITDISAQAFYGCSALESVKLPSSLWTIGNYAFGNCSSLKSITIPSSVSSISDNAFEGCDGLTIRCYRGSYALQYAWDNGIDFEIINPLELGDVNLDGRVNVKDATYLQMFVVELVSFNPEQYSLADVNGDGSYNVSDATAIQILVVNQ